MEYPDLNWSKLGGRLVAERDHGCWYISSMIDESHCEVHYRPAIPATHTESEIRALRAKLAQNQPDYWRYNAYLAELQNRLFTFVSQREAKIAIEFIEQHGDKVLPDVALVLRNNKFHERRSLFYLPLKSGEFVFRYDVSPTEGARMYYESRSSTRWRAVLTTAFRTRSSDDKYDIPRIWPATIKSPAALSAATGCAIVARRIADSQPPNKRKSPGTALR